MQKSLKLSWSRFAVVCLAALTIPVIALSPSASEKDAWVSLVAIYAVLTSTLTFMAFGWSRLRAANALTPIPATDRAQIIKYLVGPRATAIVWFVSTMLLPFLVLGLGLFLRRQQP